MPSGRQSNTKQDKTMLMITCSRIPFLRLTTHGYTQGNACLTKSLIKLVHLGLTLYYCCKQVNSRGQESRQPGGLRSLWQWYTGAKTRVPLPKRSVRQGLPWGCTPEQHKPALSSITTPEPGKLTHIWNSGRRFITKNCVCSKWNGIRLWTDVMFLTS